MPGGTEERIGVVVEVSPAWRATFPDARVGVLAMRGVANPDECAPLEERVRELEGELRRRLAGADRAGLSQLPSIQPYQQHYRRFGQTYHVLLQLESVVLKGKPLRSRGGALATAMFAAEVDSGLLTAGHELDAVAQPLVCDVSVEGDAFVGIGGQEQALKPDDMLIRDQQGVISDVLYGPDQRTRLRPETTAVLFTTYAPAGIEAAALDGHLRSLEALVRRIAPDAETLHRAVHPAA